MQESDRLPVGSPVGTDIAHDLKNIFAVIRYNAELALEEAGLAGTAARDCITRILEACGRARDLVHRSAGGAASAGPEPGAQAALRAKSAASPGGEDTPRSRGAPPVPTEARRILFVDDDEAITRAGARLLEHLGYRVVTAASGPEALELLREDPDRFDVLLADYCMPGQNGLDLGRAVQTVAPGLPVILCTGRSDQIGPEELAPAGVVQVLQKPIRSAELVPILRLHLRSREN